MFKISVSLVIQARCKILLWDESPGCSLTHSLNSTKSCPTMTDVKSILLHPTQDHGTPSVVVTRVREDGEHLSHF